MANQESKNTNYEKSFPLRLPKDIWEFLRDESHKSYMSMNTLILNCLKNYKEKVKESVDS